MVFSSTIFLFLFLPIFLGIYFLLPNKFKNLLILLFSLLFYSWGENALVIIMIASAVIDYSCGRIIENGYKRTGLFISLATNLSFLGFFKYFNFTFDNFHAFLNLFGVYNESLANLPKIALPIGISFYTFQTLSYTIDVYRGSLKANRNFIDFAAYVTMFPQLVAGPIVRYSDINNQLQNKSISLSNFSRGVERFVIGLGKKVLIANAVGQIATEVFDSNINDLSTYTAWVGIIAYSFQIYFDFSGYSDMAIGLGKMMGFDFVENFNFPYISKSIKDFWRRWHISLSTWFRDYLYISLGGNRKGKLFTYRNLLIVFFITGLWHGSNWAFVVWGLFHGLFLIIEKIGFDKILIKLPNLIQHLYTLIIVMVDWVFFKTENLENASLFIKKLFIFSEGDEAVNSYLNYFNLNSKNIFILIVSSLCSIPAYKILKENITNNTFQLFKSLFVILILFLSIIDLVSGSYNPFIYLRF